MVPLLEVYDCAAGADKLVGRARFTLRHGSVSTTFSYDEAYLASEGATPIDPTLPLAAGPIHGAGLPGSFRDSAPDRWGRHLIDRARRMQAGAAAPRQLDEVDYLVGVFDQTREGSLRFCEPGDDFLASSAPIPPLVQLPELMAAARAVAADEAGRPQVKELLDAGSGSLGGARPKASVIDDGKLLLAKFAHPHDEWDVMAWEKTMLDMAEFSGIEVPRRRLVRIGDESVLVLERFDRENSLVDGLRIGFMSGMTLLGSSDGEQRDYAELAEAIAEYATDAEEQLKAFFLRVAFSVTIGNTDDHLRNWGFLRRKDEWGLSPLFDVNPNPYSDARRVTSLVGEDGAREAEGLKELAAYAGLGTEEASRTVEKVLDTAARWQDYARKNGIREKELKLFAPLFRQKAKALRSAFGL